jgi:hypothetical protein
VSERLNRQGMQEAASCRKQRHLQACNAASQASKPAARPSSMCGCGWRKVAGGVGGRQACRNGSPWGVGHRAATWCHPPAAPLSPCDTLPPFNVSSNHRPARLVGDCGGGKWQEATRGGGAPCQNRSPWGAGHSAATWCHPPADTLPSAPPENASSHRRPALLVG